MVPAVVLLLLLLVEQAGESVAVGPRAGPRVRAEGLRLRAEAGEDGKRLAGGRRAQMDPETLRMVPSGPCQGTRVLVPCFHVSSLFQG